MTRMHVLWSRRIPAHLIHFQWSVRESEPDTRPVVADTGFSCPTPVSYNDILIVQKYIKFTVNYNVSVSLLGRRHGICIATSYHHRTTLSYRAWNLHSKLLRTEATISPVSILCTTMSMNWNSDDAMVRPQFNPPRYLPRPASIPCNLSFDFIFMQMAVFINLFFFFEV